MKQRGFVHIAVLVTISAVAFVLLVVGGLTVITQKQLDFIKAQRSALVPTPSVDTATGSTELTAGWQIYRNEQYGFEFKFPATWQQREREEKTSDLANLSFVSLDLKEKDVLGGVMNSYPSRSFTVPIITSGQRLRVVLSNVQTSPQYILQEEQKMGGTSITVGGVAGMYKEDGYSSTDNLNMRATFPPSVQASQIFNVWLEGTKDDKVANRVIFNTILSTFKFIEPGSSLSIVDKICAQEEQAVKVSQCGSFYTTYHVDFAVDENTKMYDSNGNALNVFCGGIIPDQDPRCIALKDCKVVEEVCSKLIKPTVVLRAFGQVSTTCSVDSDCEIVNRELDHSFCFVGMCDEVDYALSKYVAVNKTSFEQYRSAQLAQRYPNGCQGQPVPMCPVRVTDRGLVARCLAKTCRKAPWADEGGERELPSQTQASGEYGAQSSRLNAVAKSEVEFKQLWRNFTPPSYPPPTVDVLPSIDFSTQMVIGVALGEQATGGYGIQITKVLETKSELDIYVKETLPGSGCPVTEAITHQFYIISVGRVDKNVIFKTERQQGQSCR